MFQKLNIAFEIVLCLARQPKHLRGIAQVLELSPATVLRNLDALLDKNVVDFVQEGRNKRFFLKKNLHSRNLVYMAEYYKLGKAIERYPELAVILQDVVKKISAKPVILFGSYAKFNAKSSSDIDIYANSENKEVKKQLSLISPKLSVKFGDFDLDTPLAREIVKDHVIVSGVEEFYEKTKFFGQAESRGQT